MESALVSWLVSLVSGGAGGNIVGAIMKDKTLGPKLNTIIGAAGGALGGQVLPMLMEGLGGGGIMGNVGASAIGGIALPLIAGFFKKS